ncbi:hypothetical protein J2S49_000865 [Arcanobacterium wilhelmae]|uniref:Uncharacterized protein n=1 Tax=Arcanobacterium wilhelmae TaxID=1803177 RepID=A0ABT9NAN8_9ACTO|nr:hypothetical protein [Arcanobacterium wilhelmae]MDP9800789.1 hypothetical protein [Arcanobacterium wilhelmae]WFN90166.1 hypothetical protein P8A24_08255 [Arcanobacterium wilhelmae]
MRVRASKSAAIAVAVAVLFVLVSVFALPAWKTAFDAERRDFGGRGQLLVVGIPGLRWDQVDDRVTPEIESFTRWGVNANLSVVTRGETACPDAGWLTLNAGTIAQAPACGAGAGALSSKAGEQGLSRDQWASLVEVNVANPFEPEFGVLAQALRGKKVVSIGRGGAIASADEHGVPAGAHYELSGRTAAQVYEAEGLEHADVVFADLGPIGYPSSDSSGGFASKLRVVFGGGESESVDQARLRAVDRAFGELVKAAGDARVMLIALGDTGSRARLHVFSYGPESLVLPDPAGGSRDAGVAQLAKRWGGSEAATAGSGEYASSWSTRKHGLIQLTDVVPTILSAVGVKAPNGARQIGSEVWSSLAESPNTASRLEDAEKHGAVTRSVVGVFYTLWGISALGAFALLWRWRKKHAKAMRMPRWLVQVLLSVASLPVASFLINLVAWWNSSVPVVGFVVGVVVIAGVIGVGAEVVGVISGRLIDAASQEPAGVEPAVVRSVSPVSRNGATSAAVVAFVTACVIGLDAIYGSALHSPSVLGDQPQSGGRFYGLSNAPFTVFAVSMLVLAAAGAYVILAVKWRGVAVGGIVALGVASVVIDGSSDIGADFGGVPALVVAFSLFALMVAGKALRVRNVIAMLAVATGVTVVAAFIDWLRPAQSRTHLGKFFDAVVHGDAWQIVVRKLGFLLGSVPVIVWVLILALVFGAAWFGWRQARSGWRLDIASLNPFGQAAIAICALAIVGFALNDSGLVLPMAAIFVGVPLICVSINQ